MVIFKFIFHRFLGFFFKLKVFFLFKKEVKNAKVQLRNFCIGNYYTFVNDDFALKIFNINKDKLKVPHYIPGFAMTNLKIAYYLHRKGYLVNEYFIFLEKYYYFKNKKKDDLADVDDKFLFFQFLSLEWHLFVVRFYVKR
jgi:hypothetical protein